MTKDQLIYLVDQSKEKALKGESKLTHEVLAIRGFSTPTMRHFYNNLAAGVDSFMEVGAYAGGVLLASAHGNKTRVVGWEDESQHFGVKSVYDELRSNMEKFNSGNVHLFNGDFFSYYRGSEDEMEKGFDVVVYDGEHSYESQRKAVSALVPYMHDLCLMCVDDAAWDAVREGTRDGLKDIAETHDVIHEWYFSDGVPDGANWHNSLALYLIQRNAKAEPRAQ